MTYLLPLRVDGSAGMDEALAQYLRAIAEFVDDVVVADGSPPEVVARHRERLGPAVRVLANEVPTRMGKVGNVLTGVRHAQHDKIVIADDDVRYDGATLRRVVDLLDTADVVRPQNFFSTLPWHARVDTARTLIARATGGDWPGTLGVRRTTLLAAGGYRGDVMFENYELVRTVRAAGGREAVALDVLVAREPPTTAHFMGQQVRQAYDEFARPARLAVSLAILPAVVLALLRGKLGVGALATAAVIVVAAAESARRRDGGARVYPATSSLLAPPWLAWRSACSWCAVGARSRGGVRYRGVRIRDAATRF